MIKVVNMISYFGWQKSNKNSLFEFTQKIIWFLRIKLKDYINIQQIMKNYHLCKILLLGDSAVGKSSLLLRFTQNQNFNQNFISTIGIDFKIKNVQIQEENVKIIIWDTAGQERFRSITSSFYKGAQGIIIVYDISNRSSFDNIQNYWITLIKRFDDQTIVKFLIGNKLDLEEKREIKTQEGRSLADRLGMQFLETSAKDASNVEQAFINLAAKITSQSKSTKIKPKQNLVKYYSDLSQMKNKCC